MEETLKEIEKALDVNEDLDPYDQDRLNELNKVYAIKDTLKGDDIYDKRKVDKILDEEKSRIKDEIDNKKNKLGEYPSGNSTPTSENK